MSVLGVPVDGGSVVVVVTGGVVVVVVVVVVGGAESTSTTVTATTWSATLAYSAALDASTTEMVTVAVWSPSTMPSVTPVTTTSWAVSQLAAVNVSCAGDTVASPVSEDVAETTTSEVGWVLRTTVIVVVPPSAVLLARGTTPMPAESLSVVITATEPLATLAYSAALDPSTIAKVTVEVWLPSTAVSSTPVTVTVCALSQFESVNVSCAGDTVASPVSEPVTSMTTLAVGLAPKTAVKVASAPASVTRTSARESVRAAVSTSVTVTATVWSASESKSSSEAASFTASVTVTTWSPSSTESGIPVIVTVWAVSQFESVNVSCAGDTVVSPVSELVASTTTFDDGSPVNSTVKVCVDPVSETVRDVSDTVKPGAPQFECVTDRCPLASVRVVESLAANARYTLQPDGTTPVAELPAPS